MLLSYLRISVMIFLYFIPFLSLKNPKITISGRKEFHIRSVQLKDQYCPHGIVRFIGQSTTYGCPRGERRVLCRTT